MRYTFEKSMFKRNLKSNILKFVMIFIVKKVIIVLILLYPLLNFSKSNQNKTMILLFETNMYSCSNTNIYGFEKEIKDIINDNFKDNEVIFEIINLNNSNFEKLINVYDAKSKTLVILKQYNNQVISKDISYLVDKYLNKKIGNTEFERELLEKIKED